MEENGLQIIQLSSMSDGHRNMGRPSTRQKNGFNWRLKRPQAPNLETKEETALVPVGAISWSYL